MEQQIVFENTNVFYRVFGNGHPVVFLHGFLENTDIWGDVVEKMGAYQVVIVDLPGHGKSGCPEGECTMKFMANSVLEILKEQGISNPIVFGHSMGGYVGLELAQKMAINLVLVHSNFWADSETKKKDRDRVVAVVENSLKFFVKQAIPNLFYYSNLTKNAIQIQRLIKSAGKIPEKHVISVTLGMRNRQDFSDWEGLNQVHVIQGDNDPVIPLEFMKDKIKQSGKQPELMVLENCGHMGFFEQPEMFLRYVLKVCSDTKNERLS